MKIEVTTEEFLRIHNAITSEISSTRNLMYDLDSEPAIEIAMARINTLKELRDKLWNQFNDFNKKENQNGRDD